MRLSSYIMYVYFFASLVLTSCHTKPETSSKILDSLHTFTIHGREMSIMTPRNWKKQYLDSNAVGFHVSCPDTTQYCPVMVINFAHHTKGTSLASIVQRDVKLISSNYPMAKVSTVSNVEINNVQMKAIDFTTYVDHRHLGGTWLYSINSSRVLFINFMASNQPAGAYEDQRDFFLKLVESLEIR